MNFNDSMFRLPFWVVNDERPALPLSQGIDWGAAMLRIPKVHELGFKGKGIRIAVIDTAAQLDHPDLQGAITQHFNTTAEPYNSIAGHSTGVCGIIGARDNQIGVVSMAPECEIIPIKALFEHGGGDLQDVVGAIELAIQLKVDIINMSLGTTSNVPALHSAIKRAASAGIIIVCAAGNTGREGIHYPARYDECISVGAINQYRIVSSFSTRGLSLEVAAPGEVVLTTWKNSSWAKVSGTCIRGDQWVHTEHGYTPISEIEIGEKVYTFNEKTETLELKRVRNKISNGVKDIYRVVTNNGEIYCTDNHPFLQSYVNELGVRNTKGDKTYERGLKWSQLRDLKKGDAVLMSQVKHDDISSEKVLSSVREKLPFFNLDTAYFMGYWLGDGWFGTSSLVVYAKNHFWEQLRDRIDLAFPENNITTSYRKDRNEYSVYIWGESLKEAFKRLGFKAGALNKDIPSFIFGLPKSYREAILAGIFDSDGTLNEYTDGRNGALNVNSKTFTKGFKRLMESLGIRCSNIFEQAPRTSVLSDGRIIAGRNPSFSSTTYQFHKLQPLKKHLLDQRYVDVLEKNDDDWLSQNSVGRITVDGRKVRPYKLENPDLYYGKIVKIEEIGEDEVWDITVEDNHNFLCENFIVHNSFSAPHCAGIAALALQAGIPFNAQLLKETSIDIEEPGRDIKSGYGLINPVAIIERRQRPNPASSSSAPEPCPDLADAQQARAILAKAIQNLQNITNRTASDVNNIQVELKESERLLQQY